MKTRTAATAMHTALVMTGIVCWSIANIAPTEAADGPVVMQLSDQGTEPFEPEYDEAEWFGEELPVALPDHPIEAIHVADGCPHCHGISRDPGRPTKPHRTMPGDVNRGDCPPARYQMDRCRRAGNPHRVAKWAQPSLGKHYSAWFVGGGAAFGGRGRCADEGTWGLDYDGWLKPRRVWLNWTGGRYQGGEGAYQTEGRTKLLKHD